MDATDDMKCTMKEKNKKQNNEGEKLKREEENKKVEEK